MQFSRDLKQPMKSLTMERLRIVVHLLVTLFASTSVVALNVPTHRLINREAATTTAVGDSFDVATRESLGLVNGVASVLRGADGRSLSIAEWLAEGGEREDDGVRFSTKARFYRHFHNPLLPWTEAGLRTRYPFHLLPHQYTSSLRWMQTESQATDDGGATGGDWSWQQARRLHYLVLTTEDAREREAKAADLFRALGQIMHLVVDASVPEHVRNDAHPFGAFSREVLRSRTAGNYEYWVSDRQARLGDTEFTARYLSTPIGPPAEVHALPPPPGESVAKRPVARLVDADRYLPEGPDPNVTLSGPIGIAEFANANFFSENTLMGVDSEDRPLPFPRRTDLTRRSDLAPLSAGIRGYFEKRAGQGLVTRFALAECRLEGRAAALPPYACMDEAVWEETAAHMLPRAVGYARGVLEYFFRGSLPVHRVYMNAGDAFIDVENLSDEEMSGVFEVFARPNAGSSDERREKRVVVNHGAPVTMGPGATVTLPVTLLPAGQPTAAQLLVFRGRVGLEEDAVAGQVFTVPHVVAAQTGGTAALSESCRNSEFYENRHLQTCAWRASLHVVEGELIADPTVPVISRVSARALFGRPGLELDDLPIAGGVWQRQDREPNPRRFRVILGGNNPHGLALTVELVDGTIVSTPMATLIMATAWAERFYTIPRFGSNPPWYVAADRSAHTRVTANPSYRTVSLSGYPNPTHEEMNRFSIEALREHIVVRAIPSETSYSQRWVDEAIIHTTTPPGGPVLLEPILQAEFDALPFGPPPRVPWEAVIERLYDPAELELLKTFVTTVPPPRTFTAVGRLP